MPWVSVGLYSVMVSDGEPYFKTQLMPWASVGLFSVMVSDGEPMSSNTADVLGLSRAILCNGK